MSCSVPSKHYTKTVVYFIIKNYLIYCLIFRKSVDCILFPQIKLGKGNFSELEANYLIFQS